MTTTLARSPLAYPHGAPPAERIAFALHYAILAPSSHNSQPWLFHLAGDRVDLLADRTRALPVVDPRDRELTISCGAALHHLRTAFAAFGEAIEVDRTIDGDRLARIHLLGRAEASARARRRLDAATERRTVRTRFDGPLPSGDVVRELERAAIEEQAAFVLAEDGRRHRLADLVAEGDRLQAASAELRRELAAWIHPNRSRRADGMPASTIGMGDLSSIAAPFVVRTFDLGKGRAARDRELAEGSPLLGVLGTRGDGPGDWLAAGEALSAVLLDAAARELAASYLNQPVEVAALRPRLGEMFPEAGIPQLVVRLGTPAFAPPESDRSSRRPLEDVVI